MIDLNKLEHFVAVVASSSFAGAAQDLHISQSALSRSIQSLESSFDVRLMNRERGRTGVSLTPAGIELYYYARELLHSAHSVERAISTLAGHRNDQVSFGVGPMLANTVLAQAVRGMITDFPDVENSILVSDSATMMTRLLEGKLSFYVGVAPPVYPESRVKSEHFGEFGAHFYARDGHPLRGAAEITIDDVLEYPIIAGSAWKENLLRIDEHIDRRVFEAALLMDNYPTLEQLALTSDCVLAAAFQPLTVGLGELPIAVDIAHYNSKIMVFTRVGFDLSEVAAEHLRRLRLAYEEARVAA